MSYSRITAWPLSKFHSGLSRILAGSLLMLVATIWFMPAPAEASADIFAKADRRCVACHRRLSFQEPPPPGEEWEVHVSVNEFIQEAHEPLSCGTCHQDIVKVPHRKDVKREVDCVSCHRRHPEFVLRDNQSEPVLQSGLPLSTMKTCGVCHDTEYIAASSDHANAGADQLYEDGRPNWWEAGPGYFGDWDPLSYDVALQQSGDVDIDAWLKRYGSRHVGGGPVGDRVEMDCLLCHSDVGDHTERGRLITEGEFDWANSAPLQQSDILIRQDGQWVWNPDAFQQDGRLHVGVLDIRNPDTGRCAQCHGLASSDPDIPLSLEGGIQNNLVTLRSGQIIAPHTLEVSGLEFAADAYASHPLDVHLAKGLECVNCHYLLNNPVYFQQDPETRPAHIRFDPRRPEQSEFLNRPTHQFAKGQSIHGLAAESSINTLRDCESCHDPFEVHDWLPYKPRHFQALGCQSCHVPWVPGPALKAVDWTVMGEDGEPLRQYRGVTGDPDAEGAEFTGYRPVLLPRIGKSGNLELTPYNGVTSWYWLTGSPARPVTREELRSALLQGDRHHPDLIAQLDKDADGRLGQDELELETPEGHAIIQARLEEAGLTDLTVGTEMTPYPVFHNVGSDNFANRDCGFCHGRDSTLRSPFQLSAYLPGGILPSTRGYENVEILGSLVKHEDGGVSGIPDISLSGFYVLGLHDVPWVDQLGLLIFLGVIAGVLMHAMLRYVFARKRPKREHELQRVYMYDVYERLWHWVQAFMILYLIFSGLIIHKPHLFGGLSYPFLVETHNLFGLVLLVNAALALFYNLASGRFKQYLPEPKDFFARSIMQALYYTRGIFKGEPHPFEKTRSKRLNPLQEITYFAILNVLLPAQVITGIMIYWGQRNWPIFFSSLGGLPVLSPVHTGIAWLFASFVVMHVYLVTATGHRPLAAIKSMIVGWEMMEKPSGEGGPESVQNEDRPREDSPTV